ncbi:mannose receptor, C type 2 [Elysia marginata]|uniref:Mannose receptor, C type 2 n=1 Tax=Elysia marginata TaxID=1093978 RepID=A0AAV4JKE9_9GAST|nr:mannose receptor, C type 2 [Elysia marginata]
MNNFLADFVASNKSYWIGLNDRKVDGQFRWLDFEDELSYERWAQGEPNNKSRDDNCVQINNNWGRKLKAWTDDNCFAKVKFICERYQESTLCPVGWTLSYVSGTCLKLYVTESSWQEAETTCENHGASLAMIQNDGMNNFLSDLTATEGNSTDGQDREEEILIYRKDCSGCLGNGHVCDTRTGLCHLGCEVGYHGALCEACPNNTFGANCSRKCSDHCGGSTKACNVTTGECLYGCADGFVGDMCFSGKGGCLFEV